LSKVHEVEIDIHCINNFARINVKLGVRKALDWFTTLVRGGQMEFYKVKFEKNVKIMWILWLLWTHTLRTLFWEHDES
jgi:hypothetical protein